VSVKLDSLARVLIDGKPGSIAAVRAGFVAVVKPGATGASGSGKGKGKARGKKPSPAGELFAFSPPRQRSARLYDGTIASVSGHAIRLQAQGAGTVTVTLAAKSAVYIDGRQGSTRDLRAGQLAVVRTGPRLEVWAFGAP
jgi:hypothetical protein